LGEKPEKKRARRWTQKLSPNRGTQPKGRRVLLIGRMKREKKKK